jgi:ABC-2 type transport system ATP-binding protein
MSATTRAGGAAVVFDRVVKRYGALTALDGVSFEIEPARMFGLIGPDGAGKTTTIRLLCGLLHADGGSVRVLGHDPVRQHDQVTRTIGYLSQRFSLYGDLSIDENIAFFAEIHGLRDYGARRQRLLEMTQLTPFRSRLADRLSGGMKQKLALACTLVHEPQLIVLDEPTTGVDPVSRREFWKLLSEFLESGITIVLSTPYLDEAERCSRVALLHEGRVLALDAPDRLRDAFPGRMLEVLAEDQDAAVASARALPEIDDVQTFGERIHLRLRGAPDEGAVKAIVERLRATIPGTRSVRPVRASLEDVFIARLMAGEAPPAAQAAPR